MSNCQNPLVYFEIPVEDLDRAMNFYNKVFGFELHKTKIDGLEMALFPFQESAKGISGALVKGEIYKPTITGVLVYFGVKSIDDVLKKAVINKGKVLYSKTSNGELGYVAEFKDSEGNRIALHQAKE